MPSSVDSPADHSDGTCKVDAAVTFVALRRLPVTVSAIIAGNRRELVALGWSVRTP